MPNLGVMFKTTKNCNMACSYCYSKGMIDKNMNQFVPLEYLDRFFAEYMLYIDNIAAINWQGGEPLLAGLEYFRNVIDLEKKHAKKGIRIFNSIQTNGILIDDEWANFFRKYHFLVGVSLDGPEVIHDINRKDYSGTGTFARTIQGIQKLRERDIHYNILCVVTEHSVDKARELYKFYKKSGYTHVQFIPAMDFSDSEYEGAHYRISPKAYGKFLCQLFKEWYEDGKPRMSIQLFDNFCMGFAGHEADLCYFRSECPANIVVEPDGNVYPCDFYINKDNCIGNINTNDLNKILNQKELFDFRVRKKQLSQACQKCKWKHICNGGCPRNRNEVEGIQEYFCQSYKMLLRLNEEKFSRLSSKLNL